MAAHSYWRLRATYVNNAVYALLSAFEIQMRSSIGGSDLCSGGTAVGSNYAGAGISASLAFDNNIATEWWDQDFGTGVWIRYQFPSAQAIVEFHVDLSLQYYDSGTNQYPYVTPEDWTFYFESSDDGSTWTTVGTWVGATDYAGGAGWTIAGNLYSADISYTLGVNAELPSPFNLAITANAGTAELTGGISTELPAPFNVAIAANAGTAELLGAISVELPAPFNVAIAENAGTAVLGIDYNCELPAPFNVAITANAGTVRLEHEFNATLPAPFNLAITTNAGTVEILPVVALSLQAGNLQQSVSNIIGSVTHLLVIDAGYLSQISNDVAVTTQLGIDAGYLSQIANDITVSYPDMSLVIDAGYLSQIANDIAIIYLPEINLILDTGSLTQIGEDIRLTFTVLGELGKLTVTVSHPNLTITLIQKQEY